MKLSIKSVVFGVVILIALGTGGTKLYHWYQYGRFLETTDNAYVKADSITIRPEISGRLEQLLVHENQYVHKGQLLVQIAPAEYQAKVLEAKARQATSQAALSNAQEQLILQQKKLDEASANIDAAKAALHRDVLQLRRYKKLEQQSFDSKQQLQNVEAAVAVDKANVSQTVAAKAAAQQMLKVLDAQRKSAEAQIKVADATLAFAQTQLDKTRIYSPADGIVGDLGARIGASVQPNLTLLHVVPLPNIYVVANYKETQIGHMSIGQPVTLEVDAKPDVVFTGVVASLAPATGTEFSLLPQDNATGNFNKIVQRVPVRIRITGPKDQLAILRPGLSVVPSVDTRDFEQQLSYLDDAPAPRVADNR